MRLSRVQKLSKFCFVSREAWRTAASFLVQATRGSVFLRVLCATASQTALTSQVSFIQLNPLSLIFQSITFGSVPGGPSGDENPELCATTEAETDNWLAVGLGAAGGAGFAIVCLVLLCRSCCQKRATNDIHVPY